MDARGLQQFSFGAALRPRRTQGRCDGQSLPASLARKALMYSAHLSLQASAPTRHDKQFNEQPNETRKEACHTKEGIPAMPRAKPEGETQAGNQPMRRRLGGQDYSSLKTAGTRTGITDLSGPPLLPLPHPPPPCHRARGYQ